jgi:NhaP-type Na+/H+ or K+/H+ antiporter
MTWPVASGSLLLGFAVAQATGIRPLGGIVLFAGCAWCGLQWLRRGGRDGYTRTALLVAIYLAGFVLSHVIADTLGAWGSVLLVAAGVGLAAYLLADRETARVSPARARP